MPTIMEISAVDAIKERLNSLRVATDEVLKSAMRRRNKINGAINWADLHCCEAFYRIDDAGRESWEVIIEEAAPDATQLQSYVCTRLTMAGWYNVAVGTEW